MALSNRLLKDPAARTLTARFVLLKIVTEDPQSWSTWTRKYKSEGNGIPRVFVVRADGKQIYGKSGAPKAVPRFLAAMLKISGRIPTRKELIRLTRDVKTVRKKIEDGEIRQAAMILSRGGVQGMFADPAVTLQKLAAELTAQGKAALAEAEKKLQSPETAFEGVLALVQTERQYDRLAALRKPIVVALKNVRKNTAVRNLLEPARLVDRAQVYEAGNKPRQAMAAWQRLQSKFPGTRSATLAAERIAALEKDGVTVTTKPKTKPKTPGSSRDEKRAASQLRLGKLLLKRNPDKARAYFERAIKLAPRSKIAAEARKLLKSL